MENEVRRDQSSMTRRGKFKLSEAEGDSRAEAAILYRPPENG
jgi:hypothetical protein